MNMPNQCKEKQNMCENMCDKKYDVCILTNYNYYCCRDALTPRGIDNVSKRIFKNVILANVNGLGTGQAHFFTENGEYILVPWSMIVWMLPAK